MVDGMETVGLDGTSVAGSIDLIFELAEPTQCPDTIQDALGVPQIVDVVSEIDGATLSGVLIILLQRGTPVSPTGGPVAMPETRT